MQYRFGQELESDRAGKCSQCKAATVAGARIRFEWAEAGRAIPWCAGCFERVRAAATSVEVRERTTVIEAPGEGGAGGGGSAGLAARVELLERQVRDLAARLGAVSPVPLGAPEPSKVAAPGVGGLDLLAGAGGAPVGMP